MVVCHLWGICVNTYEYLSLFPSFEECVLLADWLFSPFGKYCAYSSTQALPTVCFVSHIPSTALSKTDCRIRVFAATPTPIRVYKTIFILGVYLSVFRLTGLWLYEGNPFYLK